MGNAAGGYRVVGEDFCFARGGSYKSSLVPITVEVGDVVVDYSSLDASIALNGTNYDDWKESLNMYLTISEKDLALREPKPVDLSFESTITKYTIEKGIRDSIPEKDTTVEYLKAVGNKYKKLDKTQKNYYLSVLKNTRYDRVSNVKEHILKLYAFFRTSYNSQEAKFSVYQMISIVTQEEEAIKKNSSHSVNYVSHSSSSKSRGLYKEKGKKHESLELPNLHINAAIGHKCQRPNDNSFMLWHRHLGHISREKLEHVAKQGSLQDLDFSDFETCVDYIKAKFPARARIKGAKRSENSLDLIHTNICGPITPLAIGSFRYFITFIDDYSHHGWIEFLREKGKSFNAFKTLKAIVKLKSRKLIKYVRFDRGGEFYRRCTETGRNPGPFALYLQEHGIEAQYTMPSTPQ
ncbi:uncharacterized protein LOC129319560 [Prosopis cineraria]|uniref:uncharacterized protein LOC129319560 n=1 Tax=Prosopis cineraria TaxID=364024 RepID=UPI00240EBD5B|nr:uncharacterized protein LOC129319560 [Prosopis cineraria]